MCMRSTRGCGDLDGASHNWVDSMWRKQHRDRKLPEMKGSSVDWRLVNVGWRSVAGAVGPADALRDGILDGPSCLMSASGILYTWFMPVHSGMYLHVPPCMLLVYILVLTFGQVAYGGTYLYVLVHTGIELTKVRIKSKPVEQVATSRARLGLWQRKLSMGKT